MKTVTRQNIGDVEPRSLPAGGVHQQSTTVLLHADIWVLYISESITNVLRVTRKYIIYWTDKHYGRAWVNGGRVVYGCQGGVQGRSGGR